MLTHKKIRINQNTWYEIGGKKYNPGDIIEIKTEDANELILSGSATEIKEEVNTNVNKASSSSSKT